MKSLYILFYWAIGISTLSWAQTDTLLQSVLKDQRDAFIEQTGSHHNGLIEQTGIVHMNKAVITQAGSHNTATIQQTFLSTAFRDPNAAAIQQNGMNNRASIEQIGAGNITRILQQGNDNSASQRILGTHNITDCVQIGNNLSSQQYFPGSGYQHAVFQRGNDNRIVYIETRAGTTPSTIIQNGNGIRVTVINGH